MRLGSAGLTALLWSAVATLTTATPIANNDSRPMPVLRPRQGGTGVTPTPTPTGGSTTPTTPTSAPPDEEVTTTVTTTTTVGGGGGGGTTTSTTVVFRTITTTILVTSTSFQTTTVTSNDVATATVTNYVTSTVLAKRSLEVLPLDAPLPPAQITPPAAAAADGYRRRAFVEKRALVTVVVTVTGPAAGVSTVVSTRTSTVVFTTTSNTVFTSLLTSTQFNNARTTVTVESTLTVTSTSIDTAAPTTVDTGPTTGIISTPTGSSGPQDTGGSDDSGGLSTGAQAGIGVGVGLVGLAVLLAAGWWAYKRHRANRPSRSDLDDMRAYDPNGPSPLHEPTGMSETGGGFGRAPAGAGAMRRQPVPKHQLSPPSQSVSPLSKQAVSPTSAGHSRPPTGGAQELGGTGVMPAEMGGDEVVEMGDSEPRPQQALQHTPAAGRPYNSGPVPDTYEMPAESVKGQDVETAHMILESVALSPDPADERAGRYPRSGKKKK
ncbi:hypothetical protein LY76DRAFT_608086 [Colletotrichum caudatum]|nr:hypothetical protein LY76DRAFT_608086 [Colletotrichum caudatum]